MAELSAEGIVIGGMEIQLSRPGYIWVIQGDGEAMEISESLLAEWLEKFYEEHF